MKTKLPLGINTAEQAMKFISALFNNNEHFNFEDDANTVFKEVNGKDSKIFTIREAKRVNELIGDCYAVKEFDPEKYLCELMSNTKTNPFQQEFVEMYYPNYFGSDTIATLNDYWKEVEELTDLESLKSKEYNPQRHEELIRLTKELELEVYESAIANFMTVQQSINLN